MKYNCPKCHSTNTQNIKIAYGHAKRENEKGQETISKFGEDLDPPEASDPIDTGGFAGVIWGAGWFFGLWYTHSLAFAFHPKTLLWIGLSSTVVFFIVAVKSVLYNATRFLKEEKILALK